MTTQNISSDSNIAVAIKLVAVVLTVAIAIRLGQSIGLISLAILWGLGALLAATLRPRAERAPVVLNPTHDKYLANGL